MATKKDLIREVADLGLTQSEARTVVESLMDEVTEQLAKGRKFQVTNFGRFEVRRHSGRTMTNPKTGEEHQIEPHNVVFFKPSQNFVDRFQTDDDD